MSDLQYFPRLPLELRHYIWRKYVATERLVHIHLHDAWRMGSPQLRNPAEAYGRTFQVKNELGNIISSYPYYVHIPTLEGWSPYALASVNREARMIFLKAYRIRIPVFAAGGIRNLYINPESNTIWLVGGRDTAGGMHVVSFLHDAVVYDPKGIGIMRLALGGQGCDELRLLATLQPSTIPVPLRDSITTMLKSSLKAFYSVLVIDDSRHHVYTRLFPRTPHVQTYRRMVQDHRLIDSKINYICNQNTKGSFNSWNTLNHNFGITSKVPMQLMVSVSEQLPSGLVVRDEFIRTLRDKQDRWMRWKSCIERRAKGQTLTADEQALMSEVHPPEVAGFWTFPADSVFTPYGQSQEAIRRINREQFEAELWSFTV